MIQEGHAFYGIGQAGETNWGKNFSGEEPSLQGERCY